MAKENQDQARERLLKTVHWDVVKIAELVALQATRDLTFASKSTFEPGVLTELGRLRWLQWLDFNQSEFTPEQMDELTSLTGLRRLDFQGCGITDEHMERLTRGSFPRLSSLWLGKTAISDVALAYMKRLPDLQWLILSGTAITDAGLASLVGVDKLETLHLFDTGITDAGILQLATLPRISLSSQPNQFITENGLAALRAAQRKLRQGGAEAVDAAERAAAEEVLRRYLGEMETWERDAPKNSPAVKQCLDALMSKQNPILDDAIFRQALADLELGKAAIYRQYCVPRQDNNPLVGSLGTPMEAEANSVEIQEVAKAGRNGLIFYVSEISMGMRSNVRYTLRKTEGRWLLAKRGEFEGGRWRDREM